MMRAFLVALLLISVIGCSAKHRPAVWIDETRDVSYAKAACEVVAVARPCIQTPETIAIDVERDFRSAFLQNPTCRGVSFTDESDIAKWAIDFKPGIENGEVNYAQTEWRVVNAGSDGTASGNLKDLSSATTSICTVVKGQGGVGD
jgi:hypothetical protein